VALTESEANMSWSQRLSSLLSAVFEGKATGGHPAAPGYAGAKPDPHRPVRRYPRTSVQALEDPKAPEPSPHSAIKRAAQTPERSPSTTP